MEQVIRTTSPRMHPLVTAAAVSVIALSVTGIAAFTGVLPGKKTDALSMTAPALTAPVSTLTTTGQPTVIFQNAPAPVEVLEPAKPKVAKPKVVRTSAPAAQAGEPAYHPTAVSSNGSSSGEYNTPAQPAYNPPTAVAQAPIPCATCGTVESVREVKQKGDAKGIGAVAGGVGGALIGKQFGNGRGSTAMAVLGAVGGAFAGHQAEKYVRSTTAYEVTVRMEDGSTRTVQQANPPAWRTGERVRVNGDAISMI